MPRRASWLALAVSAALHAGAAAALLLPWDGGRGLPAPAPPIEVELLQVSTAGGPVQPDAPAQPAQADPSPEASDAAPVPPAPTATTAPDGALPPPPASPPPVPPGPAQPPRPAPQPANVNLGAGGQALADLSADSDDVVPPRPDSRYRNLPPAYPIEAMRRREQGTVRLVVHVSPAGVPEGIEVAASSGHPSLDGAAVQAVARWRFNPAQGAAGPVPFSYVLSFDFIGDRR